MYMNTLNAKAGYFAPRRLAHANLFVSHYEKAYTFYRHVFGFAEAYRQPDNLASFLSNGNTYHDLALTDIRSKYARAGQRPGLNHLAFEVASEADLVASYQAAVNDGVQFVWTANHDVAHSTYLKDPDGFEVEFYADVVQDWAQARKGIIIKKKPEWIPGVTNVPDTRRLFNPNPVLKCLDDTVARSKRVTHVALTVRNFEQMYAFYTSFAGLKPFFDARASGCVLLAGSAGAGDLALIDQKGQVPRLHHVGVEVWAESDLDAIVHNAQSVGARIVKVVDHAARKAVSVADEDGIVMQLYVNRDWRAQVIATAATEDLPFLL